MDKFYGFSILIGFGTLFFYFPVYFLFFIIRRYRARRYAPDNGPSVYTLIVYIILISIGGTIMMKNILNFNTKARTAEAKSNLNSITAYQKAYYSEYKTYLGSSQSDNIFNKTGLSTLQIRDYSYYCDADFFLPGRRGPKFPAIGQNWSYSLRPASSPDGFTCMAIGNVDADNFLDIWAVNDSSVPVQLLNDVDNETIMDISGPSPIISLAKPEPFYQEAQKQLCVLYFGIIILISFMYCDAKHYKTVVNEMKKKKAEKKLKADISANLH